MSDVIIYVIWIYTCFPSVHIQVSVYFQEDCKGKNVPHPHIILQRMESLEPNGCNKMLVSMLHNHDMQHRLCIIRGTIDQFRMFCS